MDKIMEKENKSTLVMMIITIFNSVVGIVSGVIFVLYYNAIKGDYRSAFLDRLAGDTADISRNVGIFLVVLTVTPWIVNFFLFYRQNSRLKKNIMLIGEINDELKQVSMAKEEFILNLSHEIRSPINAVIGLNEMILVESQEKHIIEYAEGISNAGKTMLSLINDILDYSKIEKGKMEIISENYDLGATVNELLNMVEIRAKSKGLKFLVDINADTPRYLCGDDLRIKQIVMNILTNAIKYTNNGSVTMKIDYKKKDENTILLCVCVSDTGIGMKPEEIERIAKPYERFDERKNRSVEGTGLGMSIVTQLLSQMSSSLKVESVYGKGSDFSFEIEQKVTEWKPLGEFDGRYHDIRHEKADDNLNFYAPSGKVLVVDDTDVNLKVVKGLLKNTALQIDTALSGPECLDMVKKKRYHAIFIDHRMPGMDGIVTLHNMREMDTENNDTPVVALTANVIAGARESYIKEGFTDFLAKPVSEINLKKMLLKLLPDDILEKKPFEENVETDEDDCEKLSVMTRHFDMDAGKEACGSEELFKEVAMEFAETAENYSYEIQTYYEQQDYENYTIKVHALKSTARLVGAKELSSEAAYMEKCGNYRDVKEIRSKTDKLLAHYIEVADEIKRVFSTACTKNKMKISRSEFKEALVALNGFNEAFDYDKVDEIVEMLSEYDIPEQFQEVYKDIKKYVFNVDQENIRATVRKFLGGQSKHE